MEPGLAQEEVELSRIDRLLHEVEGDEVDVDPETWFTSAAHEPKFFRCQHSVDTITSTHHHLESVVNSHPTQHVLHRHRQLVGNASPFTDARCHRDFKREVTFTSPPSGYTSLIGEAPPASIFYLLSSIFYLLSLSLSSTSLLYLLFSSLSSTISSLSSTILSSAQNGHRHVTSFGLCGNTKAGHTSIKA
jgi:hypothetical protein